MNGDTTPTLADASGPLPSPSVRATTGTRQVPAILALLTVLGPAAMDLYLPVLPILARDLGATTSAAPAASM